MSFKIGDVVRFKSKDGIEKCIRGVVGKIITVNPHVNDYNYGVRFLTETAEIEFYFGRLDARKCNILSIDHKYIGSIACLSKESHLELASSSTSFWDNSHRDPPRPPDSPWEWL